jgi:hypothetical protein
MYLSHCNAALYVHNGRVEPLAASMSSYLTKRLDADPSITIHYNSGWRRSMVTVANE